MSFAKKPTEKLFYQIGEVSKALNVNVSLIRFWEKEFDVLNPKKNKKGNRLFTKKDINKLKLIQHLLEDKKYTIQGAKNKIRNNPNKTETHQKVIDNLKKIKKELIEIRNGLH